MIQKVGDRDRPMISIKEFAFCVNANPMSDRQQLVVEIQKILIQNSINMAKNQETTAPINLPEELKGKKFRIRKLTPKECFRLMGVDDKDIQTMQDAGISNSAQYKLAGNSIVVDVLFHLFRKMFIETGPDIVPGEAQQLELF